MRCKLVSISLCVFFLTINQASAAPVTPLTDATFDTAITNCLNEAPVTGLCTTYGASSGFGTMPTWDTSKVTDMSSAFYVDGGRSSFNADISAWDVGNVTNFSGMFHSARAFNADIGDWNVSSGNNFSSMFQSATSFNTDIGRWDVSSNTSFYWMFFGAKSFNQDISAWDLTSATTLAFMFRDANSFNQDVRGWDVSNIPDSAEWRIFVSNRGHAMRTTFPLNLDTKEWFVSGVPVREFVPPTVTLTSDATDPQSGVFKVTATFSEAVNGFVVGDVAVGNGAAANLSGSGATYTFDVTPTADGAVTVDIAADVVTDDYGNGNTAASQLNVTTDGTAPTLEITGPTDVVTEDFTLTFTFSEGVTGFTADDVTVTNGTKGAFAEPTSGSVYTLVVTPEFGTTISVSVAANTAEDAAGNGNEASNTFEVLAGSPASAFEEHREEIRQVIVDDAARSLSSSLSVNRRMTQEARDRFIEGRRQMAGEGSGLVSRNNVPFDVDGSFELSGSKLSTRGNFFEQTGNHEGTYRRLFFGDFDIQHDADTDSTTATLTARVAWEHLVSDQTMLGYFVGGELARSTINGTFDGDQDRFGVTVGGYAVHQLDEQIFLDGFLTLGAGRNDLEMANDVLALTSDYTTHTATAGVALSGVYDYDQYEFRPELAFSYGKTWIGDVDFTGRAYGLVDDTLSLDAGAVSIANLTLRPEVVWALDGTTVADSNSQLSFAPRLICEQVKTVSTTEDCGGGAEFGLSSQSDDGLNRAEFRVIMDRVGDTTRSSFAFNLEHQF